jgi:hypothetical protein
MEWTKQRFCSITYGFSGWWGWHTIGGNPWFRLFNDLHLVWCRSIRIIQLLWLGNRSVGSLQKCRPLFGFLLQVLSGFHRFLVKGLKDCTRFQRHGLWHHPIEVDTAQCKSSIRTVNRMTLHHSPNDIQVFQHLRFSGNQLGNLFVGDWTVLDDFIDFG